jgi:hypothetical protein
MLWRNADLKTTAARINIQSFTMSNLGIEYVEILGPKKLVVHIKFQKKLRNLKAHVSPCDMQSKFLAAQRQEVGAKFSLV